MFKLLDPRLHRAFYSNDATSPAVSINFASSFGSFSDMIEAYKGPNPLPHFDPAAFEMFTIVVLREMMEVDYTRQLADRFNNFWKLFKNSFVSMIRETSPAMFIQDTISLTVDVFTQFVTILGEIEGVSWLNKKDTSSTAVPVEDVYQSPGQESEKRNLKQGIEFEGSEGESIDDRDNGNEILGDQSDSQNLWNELREDLELSTVTGVLPFQDMYSTDEDIDKKKPSIDDSTLSSLDRELDLWFGTAPELKEPPSKEKKFRDVEEAKPYVRVGGIDFVPAFKAQGWPKVAREWIKRDRKWPSPDIVDKVIREGYHLVVKPLKNSGNPECDFRISFSHAEYLLSQEMNDIMRECYRCLKKCHRAHLSTQPESLVTFHLKTILMQTIEETGEAMWTESNRAECMMKLLGNLIKALREKHLSHFFVKSCNLFSEDYVESPELLDTLVVKVEQILERPIEFANNLIKDEKDAKQSRGRWRPVCQDNSTAGSELTSSAKVRPLEEIAATSESNRLHTKVHGSTDSYLSYYDLKDIYLDICRELTNLALSDNGLESLGDLERKIVASLRECAVKHEFDDEQFSQFLETGWNKVYINIWLSNEGLNIKRMLHGIQGLLELWRKPAMKAAARNEPFDLDALLTSGVYQDMMRRIMHSFEPASIIARTNMNVSAD